MNRCISVSNIGHVDTLADDGVGTQRRLNDALRNMWKGLGSIRVVLLPFLCQRHVRKY